MIFLIALGGVSFVAMSAIVTRTPAFSDDTRRTGPQGDWRVPGYWAMYHEGKYLEALGRAFLEAEQRQIPNPDEQEGGEQGVEEMDETVIRAEIAEEFLTEGLKFSPAMINSWTALAWSAAMQGDTDRAVDMLAISWQLAPHNIAQSQPRVFLTGTLAEAEGDEMLQRLADLGATADFSVMERFRTGQHRALMDISPEYRALGAIRDEQQQ